jgi:hypothetical protein
MKDERDNKAADLIGEPARRPGRPAKHADAAARQKAYRERLKERGLREVKRVVRDVRGPAPLVSDVIDLSEVRR